jgi:uncharacterized protein
VRFEHHRFFTFDGPLANLLDPGFSKGAVQMSKLTSRYEKTFKSEQVINRPLEEVFEFFSRAENLQRITPPLLDFKIITALPIEMKSGALIDYRLKVRGLPMTWRTLIEEWNPPHRFIDTQLKGPYRLWHHTHEFIALGPNRTLMKDTVRYEVPLGPLGLVINALVVERDVQAIFKFRKLEIEKIFATP